MPDRPLAHPSRRRERLLRLALIFGGLVVSLGLVALGEAALRIADPDLLVRRRGLHRYHPELGWEGVPLARASVGGVHVTLDAEGTRNGPKRAPAPGATRVVLLGDSIAFGLGVSDPDTFAAILSREPHGLHVRSLAVQGYGPGQSLLALERARPLDRVDVVIFGLCLGNDLADVTATHHLYSQGSPKPRFVMRGDALELEVQHVRKAWLRGLFDRSYLLARLTPRASATPAADEVARRLDALRAASEEAEDTVTAIVRRMRSVAEAAGSRFLVLVFPDVRTLERTSGRWIRLRPKLAEAADLVDLVPVIAPDREAYEVNTLDHIGHLSIMGHGLVAAELSARLDGMKAGPAP